MAIYSADITAMITLLVQTQMVASAAHAKQATMAMVRIARTSMNVSLSMGMLIHYTTVIIMPPVRTQTVASTAHAIQATMAMA